MSTHSESEAITTRYVVIGGGGIGVAFAAQLSAIGREVALVARGAQLEAARRHGITYARPDGARRLDVEVYGGPDELQLTSGDVLVLATKTQDADAALAAWATQPVRGPGSGARDPVAAGAVLPIVTLQNGLEAERAALRRFATVYGAVLAMPAVYVTPGEVVAPGAPAVGLVWIGRCPAGTDGRLDALAADLRQAGFETQVVPDIERFKAGKLLISVTFALDALYPPSALRDRAAALLRSEAHTVLTAAGLDTADLERESTLDRSRLQMHEVPGHPPGGTSNWQSLSRGGSLEADFLGGEVVLQARLHGIAAPANEAVVAQLNDAGRRRLAPRSLRDEDLLALLPQLGEPPEPPERSGPAGADVLIDVAALQRALSSAHPPAILDVRWALGDAHGHRRYLEAHIPTAVYVDLDRELAAPPSPAAGRHPLPAIADLQAAAQRWGIRRGQPVVVYDDSGGLAAARAWWLLRWAGIAHVQLLDGAFGAWVAAGLPVQSGAPAPAPEPGDVTLTGGGLAVLSADESAALPDHGILLDARAPERFRGEVEPVDPRAGHIPGARNAPAAASLDGERRFLGAEALRIRFAQLGVGDDQPVGVYCGSGVTAAHLIAALQIAGIDAALYPGSWSAWSADPDRPVATEALVR